MKKTVRELNYYERLCLPFDASTREVENAYVSLTTLYSSSSLACFGALCETERIWMVRAIAEANETLRIPERRDRYDREYMKGDDADTRKRLMAAAPSQRARLIALAQLPAATTPARSVTTQEKGERGVSREQSEELSQTTVVTGAHLRNIRTAKGESLENIAAITKIKVAYLDAIEEDDHERLPAPVFIKGFIKSYAQALGLNPAEIADKYMANH